MWLLLAFAVCAGTFRHADYFASSYDWRLFETWLEAGRRSVLWYHQFPLWNPWTCGGQVYLANPQSLVATPTFPLVLAFGTALGAKLTLVAYYFCAFDGMYRLARSYEISLPSSILAAILFGTGGWLALHFAEGHCTFFGAALFPYAMYFYRRARDECEWCIPLGFIAAWIVGDGGTSTPPMCMVILTTLAAIDSVERRSPRPFLPLVAAAAIAFAVGAIRVLPALEFAVDHPRHLFETDRNFPWQMIRNAYWWKGIEPVAGKRYWFHEYGWRLPYLTIPLWLWALSVRKTLTVWIFVGVGAAIVAGSAWPYGPWWMLHHLPIFRDLRVPSRYQVMLAIGVPLLCAMALDDLRARRFWRKALTIAIIVLCAADGLAFDWVRYEKTFDLSWDLAARGHAVLPDRRRVALDDGQRVRQPRRHRLRRGGAAAARAPARRGAGAAGARRGSVGGAGRGHPLDAQPRRARRRSRHQRRRQRQRELERALARRAHRRRAHRRARAGGARRAQARARQGRRAARRARAGGALHGRVHLPAALVRRRPHPERYRDPADDRRLARRATTKT